MPTTRRSHGPLALVFATLIFGCTFTPPRSTVTIGFPGHFAGPVFSQFKCVGLMVTGEGIPSDDGTADYQKVNEGSTCAYPGLSSVSQLATAETMNFTLKIPTGRLRTFQIVGIETTAAACPTETVSQLLVQSRRRTLPASILSIHELGRTTQTIFQSSHVEIKNTYAAATSEDILACQPKDPVSGGGGGGGGGTISVAQTSMTLFSGDQHQINATGGTGIYTYTASGSASVSASGLFSAGVPGSHTVNITDSDGVAGPQVTYYVADLNVTSGLLYRYEASDFFPTADGPLIPGTTWHNEITGTLPLTGAGIITLYRTAGPKGLPFVRFSSGGKFIGSLAALVLDANFSFFAVARRRTPGIAAIMSVFDNSCTASITNCAYLQFPQASVLSGGLHVQKDLNLINPGLQFPTADTWLVIGGIYSETSNLARANVNGSSVDWPGSTLSGFTVNNGNLLVGANATSGASGELDVAEVIVSAGINNEAAMLTALRTKYGLP